MPKSIQSAQPMSQKKHSLVGGHADNWNLQSELPSSYANNGNVVVGVPPTSQFQIHGGRMR